MTGTDEPSPSYPVVLCLTCAKARRVSGSPQCEFSAAGASTAADWEQSMGSSPSYVDRFRRGPFEPAAISSAGTVGPSLMLHLNSEGSAIFGSTREVCGELVDRL